MATVRWKGGAAAVAQVTDWTYGGTFASAASASTLTVGSKVITLTHGSTVIDSFIDTLVAAWNALSATDYPEFAEMTASRPSAGVFRLTADTAGKPFTVTITEDDATGTLSAASDTTASAGPNDWSTAKNWDTGAVPVDADDVILDLGEYPILYGLSQSSIDPASLKVLVRDNGNWTLGLPEVNRDATPYPEYRTQYLTLGTVTALEVRTTSGRVKLSVGSNACTANVYETGRGLDEGTEALLWKGTHASNVLNVSGDSEVGVAVLGGETATIATLRVEDSARVRCGPGVSLTTVKPTGGSVEVNSAVTAYTARGGEILHRSGAVGTMSLTDGARLDYRGSGTLTTLTVGSGSSATFDEDAPDVTVTNCDLWAGATLQAENGRVTFTNGIDLNQCTLSDVTLLLPRNVRLSLGTPA